MPGKTSISWADRSWNPTTGCTRVSAGCDHCYAFTLHDQRHKAWTEGEFPNAPKQYHLPFSAVQLMPERLDVPLRWTKPSKIFVDSMADLFHKDVPTDFIAQVFATMAMAPQHVFQVLTKRPQRMERLLRSDAFQMLVHDEAQDVWLRTKRRGPAFTWPGWPLPNLWLGVSVEDQEAAYRIDALVKTPAAVRFLSCEPLIGPIDLRDLRLNAFTRLDPLTGRLTSMGGHNEGKSGPVHWVIAGGESGPGHREMNPAWLTDLWLQCRDAGVAFWCKQDSGPGSGHQGRISDRVWETKEFPDVSVIAGKLVVTGVGE